MESNLINVANKNSSFYSLVDIIFHFSIFVCMKMNTNIENINKEEFNTSMPIKYHRQVLNRRQEQIYLGIKQLNALCRLQDILYSFGYLAISYPFFIVSILFSSKRLILKCHVSFCYVVLLINNLKTKEKNRNKDC